MDIKSRVHPCPHCENGWGVGVMDWFSPSGLVYTEEFVCPQCDTHFIVRYEKVRIAEVKDE